MNWDVVKGRWEQLKGDARKQWGKLTDDDWSVIGGAVGLSAAAIVLPGVGPLVLAGLLAAGIAGTAGGAAVGDTLEDVLSNGVPRDELPIYQAALRAGRSVVVGSVERDTEAQVVRETFEAAGAESVDAARDGWLARQAALV